MKSLTLISARPTDIERLREWIPDTETCARWSGPLFPFPLPTHLEAALHQRGEQSFALVDEAQTLVGFGQVVQRGPGWMHLARIIVDPNARGKGYGKALARIIFERALVETAVTRITLYVLRKNGPAVHIYKQLGFQELGNNPGDLNNDETAFLTYTVGQEESGLQAEGQAQKL